MSDKKWGVVLICTSAFLILAISLLFFAVKSGSANQTAFRGLAIAGAAIQFAVLILFAKSQRRKEQPLESGRDEGTDER